MGFGKEQLWHGQRHVIGLGQPGLKIETLLRDGKLGGDPASPGMEVTGRET